MPSFQESSGLWVASLWMKQGTQDEQEEVGAVARGTGGLNITSL